MNSIHAMNSIHVPDFNTYCTYDEWMELGFHVKSGEHAHMKNDEGKAIFSRLQVARNRNVKHKGEGYGGNDDWEERDYQL